MEGARRLAGSGSQMALLAVGEKSTGAGSSDLRFPKHVTTPAAAGFILPALGHVPANLSAESESEDVN